VELPLYKSKLAASRRAVGCFFYKAMVGVGVPVILTLKDLVATGDKVTRLAAASPALMGDSSLRADHQDRGCVLRHDKLHHSTSS